MAQKAPRSLGNAKKIFRRPAGSVTNSPQTNNGNSTRAARRPSF